MQQAIFHYQVNEFGTYLFISKMLFCGVLRSEGENVVTLPHSAQRKHEFWGEIKEMSKTKKLPSIKKIALELLHQRLGHRSTISLLAGNTANVWEDIELRIYPYPFCTSCQIYSMNKKARSKNPLNPKAPFKWVFMDIIPSIAPKCLTSDRKISNYLLIVDAYSKIPSLLLYKFSPYHKVLEF